jgi:hypothetical protein
MTENETNRLILNLIIGFVLMMPVLWMIIKKRPKDWYYWSALIVGAIALVIAFTLHF